MKKINAIFIFMVIFTGVIHLNAEKRIVPIDKTLKPRLIAQDDNYIYVSETKPKILMYRADNFKFVREFGKAGEGPQEFLIFALVTPMKDNLLINSLGKISYFSREGKFIKEIRSPGGAQMAGYLPVKSGFVATANTGDDSGIYATYNFYDKKLNLVRELGRTKMAEKGFSKIDIFRTRPPFQVYEDKVFIPGENGFVVNVLDTSGKKLYKIERKGYQQRKFTAKDKREILDLIKQNNPQRYEFIKANMITPEYFPVFSFFFTDVKAEMIYFFTWHFEDEKFECFIYDMNGKFQKRMELPFQMQATLQPYPLNIYDWKMYQLIDNDETEEWEMHITDIKEH